MDPQLKAKIAIVEHYNASTVNKPITTDEVLTVWFAYILGGWKTMQMVNAHDGGGIYYEATYSREKEEMYVDMYEKIDNVCVPDDKLAELRERLTGDARPV